MSLHPGTATYNPAGNSDFTRKAEALALGISNWSTPKATDGAKGGPGQSYGSGGAPTLTAQAAQWQTPVADDQVDRLCGKINSRGEPKLSAQAIQWPTPAAQNWKSGSPASVTRADGKSQMDILHLPGGTGLHPPGPGEHSAWAAVLAACPDLAPTVGFNDCLAWVGRLAANPEVQGTTAAQSALRRMADGLAHRSRALRVLGNGVHHWQQHMRGALSALPMASGSWIWRPTVGPEGPAQMNLFEGLQP
jgi:hypothetical protein